MSLRPVHVDGAIFVAIAMFGTIASSMSSDDAAKYISPAVLWYAKNSAAALAAGFLALKMFRSSAYAVDVVEQKNGKATEEEKKILP